MPSRKKHFKHLRPHIVHAIIAALAVAIVALFFQVTVNTIFLFASMGESAALIMLHPKKHTNSLRCVGLAYMIVFFVSYIAWYFMQRLPSLNSLYISVSIFFVITISFLLMVFMDVFHGPAIGGALGFVLEGQDSFELVFLFAAVVIMLYFLKLLQYMYKEELKIEHFFKEFTKEHYGQK